MGWVGCVAVKSAAVALSAWVGVVNCAFFDAAALFGARLLDFFVGVFFAAFLLTFFFPFFADFFNAAFFTALLVAVFFEDAFLDPVLFLASGCSFGEQA